MEELLTRWAVVQSQLAGIDASLSAGAGSALATSISDVNPEWAQELTQLQTDLTLARVQVDELTRIYGPSHAERLAAEQRLASLELQYSTRESSVLTDLAAQRSRLEHEQSVLDGLLTDEQSRMSTLADARLNVQQLQANLTRVGELHASTVQTLETLQLADRTISDGRGSIQIEILDDFVVPTDAVWPQPVPLLAISAILGALLGMGIVVLSQLRRRSDPAGDASAPVMATSESQVHVTERSLPNAVYEPLSPAPALLPRGSLAR
jgi:uncharacterized protein involved in exopolysaccharide biosynthesis